MARFNRKGKGGTPAISTASLPDIIFMLLFFFMVTTTMREVSYKVQIRVPEATDVIKLEKKSLVSYIYIGTPLQQHQDQWGSASRLQLNDMISDVSAVPEFIYLERSKVNEVDIPMMTTSLKVDKETKMGIVTDVKQELRKVNALKINYSSRKVDKLN